MWQIICLCLPAVTPSERQRFFALFRNALHASGREADEMDLSLFFLHTLSSQEALTVLEERLHLVVRSQELKGQQRAMESARDIRQWVIDDHLRTLLSIRFIAYQDDNSMTENTRKVHAIVMCSSYTVTRMVMTQGKRLLLWNALFMIDCYTVLQQERNMYASIF